MTTPKLLPPLPDGSPALFLDRDGVINVEKHYVYRQEDFEFLPGIFDLCKTARTAGLPIVVVTNQAGIGRGYYTEADFHALTDWMKARFTAEGVPLAGVYYCPYHPTHGIGPYRAESPDRKPNPGMLLRARDDLGICLAKSILIGDKDTDIRAARAAGLTCAIHLAHSDPPAPDAHASFTSLADIHQWLRHHLSARPPTGDDTGDDTEEDVADDGQRISRTSTA